MSLAFAVGAVRAQGQTAEVPFEFVKGCIFVEATIDSITGKYFVDTGAPMTLLHDRAQKGDYQEIGRVPIIDVFGNKSEGIPVIVVNSFEAGQFIMPPGGLQVLVKEQGDPLEAMGIDGIVGSNFLSNMVVRFDLRRGVMILSGSVEPYGLKPGDAIPMRVGEAGHAFIEIDLGHGISEEVMFDTGSKNLLSLGGSAYKRLLNGPAMDSVATIRGSGSVGGAGTSKARDTKRVKIGEMNVGGGKFADVTSNVLAGGPVTLLGAELILYGVVTLDYPNRSFYFEPFEDSVVNAYEPVWDVMVGAFSGELKVATVWSDVDTRVEVADAVVSVDGVSYGSDEVEKFLTIQREGTATEREIVIRKEDGTQHTVISRKR